MHARGGGHAAAAPRSDAPSAVRCPVDARAAGCTRHGPARARAPTARPPDVLTDECLLDAAPVRRAARAPGAVPEQAVVRRDDGSRSSSCYVGPADGPRVRWPRSTSTGCGPGRPRSSSVRPAGAGCTGVGEAAAVLDTAAGPALQVASPRFLVTVVVQGREPGDAAWRAAGRAALARLPS